MFVYYYLKKILFCKWKVLFIYDAEELKWFAACDHLLVVMVTTVYY